MQHVCCRKQVAELLLTILWLVPIEKCGLDPTSRPGMVPTLNHVLTSTIILGWTHLSSNVGSSLHTRMSVYKYVGISGSSPLPICDRIPTTLFDTTSLGWDYLHEVVSIQDRVHITDVGLSPLISRSLYDNMWAWAWPWIEPMTLHQTCQWEHAPR